MFTRMTFRSQCILNKFNLELRKNRQKIIIAIKEPDHESVQRLFCHQKILNLMWALPVHPTQINTLYRLHNFPQQCYIEYRHVSQYCKSFIKFDFKILNV